MTNFLFRKMIDRSMHAFLIIFALVAIFPLASVFIYVIQQGAPALSWEFLTHNPAPVGEAGGGFANAIMGSFLLVMVAAFFGVPWGVACGIYLSEYPRTRMSLLLRFTADVMTGIPSIIVGLFVYSAVVVFMKGFSTLAGGIALAIIMIPSMARTTEEILKLVPDHIREAGLALGLPRWKVIYHIVLKGSIGGVATGLMLSVARAAGETAPLLFTAFNNRFFSTSLFQPVASLPVQIYTYAISPFSDWHQQAWAGALVLVLFVFAMNLTTRLFLVRKTSGRD
jgi:phosphate transport system permease protein